MDNSTKESLTQVWKLYRESLLTQGLQASVTSVLDSISVTIESQRVLINLQKVWDKNCCVLIQVRITESSLEIYRELTKGSPKIFFLIFVRGYVFFILKTMG